jgi:hypothetical protein
MKITKRSQFPKCIRHFKEVKGIALRECIEGLDMGDHIAHAHSDSKDPYQGWICMRYKFLVRQKLTLLHEVAHLIANKSNCTPPHGKKWKQVLLAIGGTFKEFSYKVNKITRTNLDYTYRNNKW